MSHRARTRLRHRRHSYDETAGGVLHDPHASVLTAYRVCRRCGHRLRWDPDAERKAREREEHAKREAARTYFAADIRAAQEEIASALAVPAEALGSPRDVNRAAAAAAAAAAIIPAGSLRRERGDWRIPYTPGGSSRGKGGATAGAAQHQRSERVGGGAPGLRQ